MEAGQQNTVAVAPPVPLARANLSAIAQTCAVPTYDPARLTPGIVHFGVGNFHRAHQAVYLDTLFGTGAATDWAIVGAGLLPSDAAMRDRLIGQDWLTTVVEQDAGANRARVVGSMVDFLPVGDSAAILAALTDPATRIVSLTITEGGYYIDAASGEFDPGHPHIVHDAGHPDRPRTVFGHLAAALRARRAAGDGPFTVMSCDNVPGNGEVARNAVVGLAAAGDPDLADWIGANVAFPNGMVDRITPATSDRERQITAETFHVADAAPVFCEDFSQWVLEDRFPAGRPDFAAAGVELVADVTPYETMKIHVLNGGHAIIGYPGGLLGIHFVHDAMGHDLIAAFLDKVERDEVIPHVPPVPNTDLAAYFARVKRRFANPKIGDTIRRLCLDGSNRQPKFIVPSVRARLATGGDVAGLALASALWCRYCFGTTDDGTAIEPNDPNWDQLTAVARTARAEPAAWLAMADIYGDLAQSSAFAAAFAAALGSLWDVGTAATLDAYLKS